MPDATQSTRSKVRVLRHVYADPLPTGNRRTWVCFLDRNRESTGCPDAQTPSIAIPGGRLDYIHGCGRRVGAPPEFVRHACTRNPHTLTPKPAQFEGSTWNVWNAEVPPPSVRHRTTQCNRRPPEFPSPPSMVFGHVLNWSSPFRSVVEPGERQDRENRPLDDTTRKLRKKRPHDPRQ